jgi:mono/diheme cytochrome c family protein
MNMCNFVRNLLLVLLCLVFASCSDDKQGKGSTQTDSGTAESARTAEASKTEQFDVNRIARGARLYQEHCAQCHGPEAQGHPDWQHAKQQGYAAAPPLDGAGPVANRRKAEMIDIIRNGVKQDGVPVMPSWKGRVSDEEIEDVITWYQALWPSQVYARWRQLKGNKS